jgi:hypothetical protein
MGAGYAVWIITRAYSSWLLCSVAPRSRYVSAASAQPDYQTAGNQRTQ